MLENKFCTDCPSDNLLIASATLITLPSICFSEHEVTTNINNKKNFHIYLIPFLFITLKVVKYHLSSLITLFNRFRLHHKAKTSILVTIILNVVINTIFTIVLPSAVPGILAGVILAIGRVIGETAALIYTAGTVAEVPKNLMGSGRTLALHMYVLSGEGLHMNQASATAVVILAFVLVINFLSGAVAKRIAKG